MPPSLPPPVTATARLTIDEDSEAQEVQVALATTGVPADVWVPFGQEHGAALEATASQVGHHLSVEGGSARGSTHTTFFPKDLSAPGPLQSDCLWIPQPISLIFHHHLPPGPSQPPSPGLTVPFNPQSVPYTVRGTLQIL